MITEDYVSFEVAKLLKEKDYCNISNTLYKEDGELVYYHVGLNNRGFSTTLGDFYEAPTLQMALKWLRDEKNIHIKVHCSGYRNYLVYAQSLVTAFHDFCIESATCSFNTYEEAAEEAIKYCLINLIK